MANLPQLDGPSATTEIDTEIDIVLRQIAESAQALSGATGSAIAMRNGAKRDGENILCVASSGDTAPPLGSRLDAHSGISGECLLTGKVLHSNNTAVDYRVDPEVCRQLGLRSIIVIPVRGRRRTAGVLEVFSTQPHAFTREHIESLKHLAEMVEMACISQIEAGFSAVARPETHIPTATDVVLPATDQTEQVTSPHIRLPFSLSLLKDRRGFWIARCALATLLLFALIGLKVFHFSANSETSKQAAQPAVQSSSPETAEILLPSSAGNVDRQTRGVRRTTKGAEERLGLQNASKVEALTSTGNVASTDPGAFKFSSATESRPQSPGNDSASNEVPSLPLTANSALPEGLPAPSTMMPELSPSISQGVTGGILEHRVQPIYPPEALAMKLEGEVVLAAVVTKTGQVRDLKLLKGSPILARAAMDAVKQWHYQPYRLNGEPLESKTEIRVRFHAQ
jgi:TonB family protein